MELVTTDGFEENVVDSDIPVLLDFFATWCAPCKALEGTLKSVESQYEGRVSFYKVNVDDEMDLAVKFNVSALPTIVLCEKGEAVDKKIGLASSSEIVAFIDAHLESGSEN